MKFIITPEIESAKAELAIARIECNKAIAANAKAYDAYESASTENIESAKIEFESSKKALRIAADAHRIAHRKWWNLVLDDTDYVCKAS